MVEKEDYLCTPTGRIKLTQRLSCANYGIYVATCLHCKEQYVGQTKNSFLLDGPPSSEQLAQILRKRRGCFD